MVKFFMKLCIVPKILPTVIAILTDMCNSNGSYACLAFNSLDEKILKRIRTFFLLTIIENK